MAQKTEDALLIALEETMRAMERAEDEIVDLFLEKYINIMADEAKLVFDEVYLRLKAIEEQQVGGILNHFKGEKKGDEKDNKTVH